MTWAAYATAYVGRYNYSAVMTLPALIVCYFLENNWKSFLREQETEDA
ncbi:MAG: hypothetical protein OGM67_11365 [Oscillospiraceae bacterium]|nr:MAG: hypothetical protein OGM67_11365 [Oscillospiraceae bacterium]